LLPPPATLGEYGNFAQEVAVFNHLEIKVLVHNTTQIQGGTDIPNVVSVPVDIMGYKVRVPVK
jgi:hypothetical protein